MTEEYKLNFKAPRDTKLQTNTVYIYPSNPTFQPVQRTQKSLRNIKNE